ncbi:MAG: transcription antitermination protein NusB [Bacteroidota bacterium]
MQSLYAFYQTEETNLEKGQNDLLGSIERIFDLYLYQLSILPEFTFIAQQQIDDNRAKMLPGHSDLNPNMKFVNNRVIQQIAQSTELKEICRDRSIIWDNNPELLRRIFNFMRSSREYEEYIELPRDDYEWDKEFTERVFRKYISGNHYLKHYYEEANIHWTEDIYLVNNLAFKTIEQIQPDKPHSLIIPGVYKDAVDDKNFVLDLFAKTIFHRKRNEKLIAGKTKNWEIDRIALIDIILMSMALAELSDMPTIPIKVSLNEYIEISKLYSTPKSRIFINGILDKLVMDLREQGEINKHGRGLVE